MSSKDKERCSECGKLTQHGEKVWKEESKKNPIWYKDVEEFNKPVSELVESLRNDLTRIRGKLEDIQRSYGFDEQIKYAAGALTSLIIALAYSNDTIMKVEKMRKDV